MKYIMIIAAMVMVSCSAPSFNDWSAMCDHKIALLPVESSTQPIDRTIELKNQIASIKADMQIVADSFKRPIGQPLRPAKEAERVAQMSLKLEPYNTKIAMLEKDIANIKLEDKLVAAQKELAILRNKFECMQESSLFTTKQVACAKSSKSIDEFTKCIPMKIMPKSVNAESDATTTPEEEASSDLPRQQETEETN